MLQLDAHLPGDRLAHVHIVANIFSSLRILEPVRGARILRAADQRATLFDIVEPVRGRTARPTRRQRQHGKYRDVLEFMCHVLSPVEALNAN